MYAACFFYAHVMPPWSLEHKLQMIFPVLIVGLGGVIHPVSGHLPPQSPLVTNSLLDVEV